MTEKVGDVILDARCRPARIVSVTPITSPHIEYRDGRLVDVGTVKYTALRCDPVEREAT